MVGSGLLAISLVLAGCVTQTAAPTPVATPQTQQVELTQQIQETQQTQQETQQNGSETVNADATYYSHPQQLDADSVLSKTQIDSILAAYNDSMGITDAALKQTWTTVTKKDSTESGVKGYFQFFKSGKIHLSPYQDSDLLVLVLGCDGMCMGYGDFYRFARDPQTHKLVLLSKYLGDDALSDGRILGLKKAITEDKTFDLASLDMPKTLAVPGSDQVVKLKGADNDFLPLHEGPDSSDPYLTKLFDSAFGPVYTMGDENNDYGVGCVYLKKPDGSVAIYGFDSGLQASSEDQNLKITFKDGKQKAFNGMYIAYEAGCGIMGRCYFTQKLDEKNLEEYATLSNGIKLYKPIKIDQNATTADDKSSKYKNRADLTLVADNYQSYVARYQYGDTSKPIATFAQYKAKNPVLFWKDPMGRWVSIVAPDFNPGAECGKPVVYLYPQKDMKVAVKVGIDHLTKTVPDYGVDGWNVLAHVGGELTDLRDGASYPYLFWEGLSDKSVQVDKGFSVARGDLRGFLTETLAQAGLNSQESKDFMEFWYPRMMENKQPYFMISFLGTQDFNKVAPLNISPRPDTLARIFMYYQPSYSHVDLQPQLIKGFARRGFTVVEWGGTSNAPWIN